MKSPLAVCCKFRSKVEVFVMSTGWRVQWDESTTSDSQKFFSNAMGLWVMLELILRNTIKGNWPRVTPLAAFQIFSLLIFRTPQPQASVRTTTEKNPTHLPQFEGWDYGQTYIPPPPTSQHPTTEAPIVYLTISPVSTNSNNNTLLKSSDSKQTICNIVKALVRAVTIVSGEP